jgi:hypothetical protein
MVVAGERYVHFLVGAREAYSGKGVRKMDKHLGERSGIMQAEAAKLRKK